MSKSKQKKNSRNANKRKSKKRARKTATASQCPSWLCAVRDAFSHEPVGIPDEEVSMSVKASTRTTLSVLTRDVGTVPGTLHGCTIAISPLVHDSGGGGGVGVSFVGFNSNNGNFGGTAGSFFVLMGQPPNYSAILPTLDISSADLTSRRPYQLRCTAAKARLTYLGTELNRAGRVTMGLVEIDTNLGGSGALTSGQNNPHFLITGLDQAGWNASSTSPQEVRNRMRRMAMDRTADGSYELTWVPTGVPQYAPILQSGQGNVTEFTESGPIMEIMIEGDQTAVASATGNTWSLDIVWHWEIIPVSRYALAIQPTPSPYDPMALSACLNGFQHLSSVGEEIHGVTSKLADGATPSTGSAWEYMSNFPTVSSLASSAYNGVRAGIDISQSPVGQTFLRRLFTALDQGQPGDLAGASGRIGRQYAFGREL